MSPEKCVHELASPVDLWEMMTVAWIRLAASTTGAFLTPSAIRCEAAKSEERRPGPSKDRIADEELLLHVLE
jgi:hypothetical protein